MSGKPDEAIEAARRAVELQPGDAEAHSYLARSLFMACKGDESCEAAQVVLRLDPRNINGPYLHMLGRACFIAGRYEEAIKAFQHNEDRGGPMTAEIQAIWASALGHIGRFEDAGLRVQAMRNYDSQFTLEHASTMQRFANEDEQARLLAGLRKAGLSA
jgi:adenylate cyclase